MPEPSDVTRLLQQLGRHDAAAAELLPLIYETLRSIARSRLRRERPDHTLQATALVHEVYLKLFGKEQIDWSDWSHFFGIAARQMRRILIDHSRAAGAGKRNGNGRKAPLEEAALLPCPRTLTWSRSTRRSWRLRKST